MISSRSRAGAFLGSLAAGGLGWGWFEAGWVRFTRLEIPVDGLPPRLAGLRIVHLSDLHLGLPSRGAHAVKRAVEWTVARRPDLRPAPTREAPPGESTRALHDRAVRARRDVDAHLAGARNDVRPVPLLRAARGDRAGATTSVTCPSTRLFRATSSPATPPMRRARSTACAVSSRVTCRAIVVFA